MSHETCFQPCMGPPHPSPLVGDGSLSWRKSSGLGQVEPLVQGCLELRTAGVANWRLKDPFPQRP